MSSVYLIIAGLGAVAAAVGSGVLLARCFRSPRADVIAWSIALLGLLISLGAQALGYQGGFDGAIFRAMELGGQVIAPLALVLALSEVAGRTVAARFCARVYIPAVAIVAVVVLTLDQLAPVKFTKAWPDPAVFYETPPRWVLMFAVGPVTALIALVAMYVVVRRGSRGGWNAALPAVLAGGLAALLLAYPGLAMLVNYVTGTSVPIRHLFTALCAAAAGLAWYAGTRSGRLRVGLLHDRGPARQARASGAVADDWEDDDPWGSADTRPGTREPEAAGRGAREHSQDRPAEASRRDHRDPESELDQTGGIDRYALAGESDGYRGGGGYLPADGASDEYGWQTRDEPYRSRDGAAGGGGGEGMVATGDIDLGPDAGSWDQRTPPAGFVPGDAESRRPGRPGGGRPGSDRAGSDRADLFGQIAIYTLLEDRIAEFDELTERVVEQVRGSEQDTLVFIIHAVPSAPMQRILYEVYRDREAYERHRRQPYVSQFETDRRPYVLATNVIELGLQQAKVSPFPSVSELFGEPGYDTSGFERPDYLRDYGRPPASRGGHQW
jgi:quinol monooxygenase YgiN